jgi:hypothetical protein
LERKLGFGVAAAWSANILLSLFYLFKSKTFSNSLPGGAQRRRNA